jgi:hypothetical protein
LLWRGAASNGPVGPYLGAGEPPPKDYKTLAFKTVKSELLLFEIAKKLSTTDLLVLASMKNAAKCDK